MADGYAFATVDELMRAYPSLEGEEERAGLVIQLASSAIRAVCDVEAADPGVLRLVAIQAAARSMQAGKEAPIGASQTSWTASPFGGSTLFQNPSGDIYLTSFERKLLGADDGTACWVNQEPA